MKSKKLKTVAQLLIVCLIAFAACKKSEKVETFEIKIDYIEITFNGAVAHVDDSISIRLHGHIGPNQCYKLAYLPYFYLDPKAQDTNRHIFEVYGIYEENKNGNPCAPTESLLDHEIKVVFREPGIYTFYDINDPDTKLGEIDVK